MGAQGARPCWKQTQAKFQRRGDLLDTPASKMHESFLSIRIYLQDARRMPSAHHHDQMHTPHENVVNRDDLSSIRVAHGTSWLSCATRAASLPSESFHWLNAPGAVRRRDTSTKTRASVGRLTSRLVRHTLCTCFLLNHRKRHRKHTQRSEPYGSSRWL